MPFRDNKGVSASVVLSGGGVESGSEICAVECHLAKAEMHDIALDTYIHAVELSPL